MSRVREEQTAAMSRLREEQTAAMSRLREEQTAAMSRLREEPTAAMSRLREQQRALPTSLHRDSLDDVQSRGASRGWHRTEQAERHRADSEDERHRARPEADVEIHDVPADDAVEPLVGQAEQQPQDTADDTDAHRLGQDHLQCEPAIGSHCPQYADFAAPF